ncbi:MAG: hypothetical protein MJ099_04975 [Clostridia bacterium]|nr:hypothetical protein [Clostridia bacterium]
MKNISKLLIALLCIVALIMLIVFIGQTVLGFLNNANFKNGETDPMFETPAETVTMPPDLYESDDETVYEDHSDQWETGEQVPVDMTIEELIEEAQNGL